MLKRIIPFAHSTITQYITKDDFVIDATCGNGHDTLFLSKLAKHVYSFDIQEHALKNTKTLLDENQIGNVTLIHNSHDRFDLVDVKPKVIMYNLGYLPGSDKSITTTHTTTISSIKKGLEILLVKGLISLTVYEGHPAGRIEGNEIQKFIQNLPPKDFNVILYITGNKKNSPYNIFIEKLR